MFTGNRIDRVRTGSVGWWRVSLIWPLAAALLLLSIQTHCSMLSLFCRVFVHWLSRRWYGWLCWSTPAARPGSPGVPCSCCFFQRCCSQLWRSRFPKSSLRLRFVCIPDLYRAALAEVGAFCLRRDRFLGQLRCPSDPADACAGVLGHPFSCSTAGAVVPVISYALIRPQWITVPPIQAGILLINVTILLYFVALYSFRNLDVIPVARRDVDLAYAVWDDRPGCGVSPGRLQHGREALPGLPGKLVRQRAASRVRTAGGSDLPR